MTRQKSDPETAAMPMERELQALIGTRLRARYAEILAEPIPDKFLNLLEKLDQLSPPAAAEGGRKRIKEEHRR
jgi:hypothetical protein